MLALEAARRLHRRVPLLDRWHIPQSITGGLLCAFLAGCAHASGLTVEFDTVLRDVLMGAFFTTVGLGASAALLRKGGPALVACLLLATVGAVVQNLAGIGMARMFGLNPLAGIMAGAVTMAGGPATALAFGETFEKQGLEGAATIGLAAAVFGILAAGLAGGFVGAYLVRRSAAPVVSDAIAKSEEQRGSWTATFLALLFSMGAGSLVSRAIAGLGITLPGYIGAMIVGAIVRAAAGDRIHSQGLQVIAKTSLSLFIVLALLTLKLWVLRDLALPLLAILLMQVLVTSLFTVFIVYRLLGRSYESAVMSAGWSGFMIGTTANAVALMESITEKHGPAPRAFTVVPVVGAFLIDFSNALVIVSTAELVRRNLL